MTPALGARPLALEDNARRRPWTCSAVKLRQVCKAKGSCYTSQTSRLDHRVRTGSRWDVIHESGDPSEHRTERRSGRSPVWTPRQLLRREAITVSGRARSGGRPCLKHVLQSRRLGYGPGVIVDTPGGSLYRVGLIHKSIDMLGSALIINERDNELVAGFRLRGWTLKGSHRRLGAPDPRRRRKRTSDTERESGGESATRRRPGGGCACPREASWL